MDAEERGNARLDLDERTVRDAPARTVSETGQS
jgi:hypothetical protein